MDFRQKKVYIWIISLNLVVLLLISSCVKQRTEPPKMMVPYIDYSTYSPSGKTIRLAPVTVGQIDLPNNNLKITGKAYYKALRDTLVRANIFEVLSEDQAADYECWTEIISQKITPGITAKAVLFINYTIYDTRTNNIVWKNNVASEGNTYGGDLTNTLETAARDNLTKFINELSEKFR